MFTSSSGTNIAQQAHHLQLYHHNHLNHHQQQQNLQHQHQQQHPDTHQPYTNGQNQRDSHQLSSTDNQLLLQNGDGPQIYQQFRGSELFSIASQNCLQTQNYHQPLPTGFSSSMSGPQYLETNQSLVAHFSQHSTVALTNSGAIANGICRSNASQFVSVMQQQHHTPPLDAGEVMSPALFFHHHNHSSHHLTTTTTTNNQQHLHMNLSSSASLSGPSLPHLQSQQLHQQQHNANHPLPRPRSSDAMLMSSIGAFDNRCLLNSTSNQSNAIAVLNNSVPKLQHSEANVVCGSTYDHLVDPNTSPRSITTASNPNDPSLRKETTTSKHNCSLETSNSTSRNNISTSNRDNYSIQFEKLTIGALNGDDHGNNLIPNNHSVNDNKQATNNSSKNSRISNSNSKIQEKLDLKKSFESPKRTFACPTCSKGFTEKFNMKRHMQIHSQSRPKYICNECSKSFAWKDNFIRHRKAAHVTSLGQYQI